MEKKLKYDFSGWATRNDLVCSDGRTIRRDAFAHCDGKTVPLVWNHQHDDPTNILGHALLENREDGVYAYCTFNETAAGKAAKLIVQHGDVDSLSIYANGLKQQGGNVMHGDIKELSLVVAGANPGAFILLMERALSRKSSSAPTNLSRSPMQMKAKLMILPMTARSPLMATRKTPETATPLKMSLTA